MRSDMSETEADIDSLRCTHHTHAHMHWHARTRGRILLTPDWGAEERRAGIIGTIGEPPHMTATLTSPTGAGVALGDSGGVPPRSLASRNCRVIEL
mmetsp:Transcript_25227/g.64086  ORF Transcript_25227/g.64086 Transcript_25227/m.64086 type:complete len:96 (-) Transcript_25227:864-1151(-)